MCVYTVQSFYWHVPFHSLFQLNSLEEFEILNKRQYYDFYLVLELGISHEFSLGLVSGLSFKTSLKAGAQQGIEVTKLSIYISVKLWLRLCFNACAAAQRKEISHELHFELNTGHPRA